MREGRAAKARISTEKLLQILDGLGYCYPYAQAIGFLAQRAGFPDDDLRMIDGDSAVLDPFSRSRVYASTTP